MTALARTIMVVDDEHDLLSVYTNILEKNGRQVHGFTHYEKALEHIEIEGCNSCQILLCDIRMPKVNGIELARRVKKLRPNMKIILMSGFEINNEEWQKTMPSSRVDYFLVKPISKKELIEAISCAESDKITAK